MAKYTIFSTPRIAIVAPRAAKTNAANLCGIFPFEKSWKKLAIDVICPIAVVIQAKTTAIEKNNIPPLPRTLSAIPNNN